jgi:hypothetical protein
MFSRACLVVLLMISVIVEAKQNLRSQGFARALGTMTPAPWRQHGRRRRAIAAAPVAAVVAACALLLLPQCLLAQTLGEVFTAIDSDKSDSLSFIEWSASFLLLHQSAPGDFEAIDADGDGRLTIPEYTAYHIHASKSFSPASHTANFGILDDDTDETLSRAE